MAVRKPKPSRPTPPPPVYVPPSIGDIPIIESVDPKTGKTIPAKKPARKKK